MYACLSAPLCCQPINCFCLSCPMPVLAHRSNALPRQHAAVQQPALQSSDGDVYAAGSSVLDAAYGGAGGAEVEPYVLSIEVQDIPGVLNQVGGPLRSPWARVWGIGGLGAAGAGQGRAGQLQHAWYTAQRRLLLPLRLAGLSCRPLLSPACR